jgi:hypothetical protein
MAVRPTPPGAGAVAFGAQIAPGSHPKVAAGGPPKAPLPTPPPAIAKTSQLPSSDIISPTKRPLPTPPIAVNPAPVIPEPVEIAEPSIEEDLPTGTLSPPFRPLPAPNSPPSSERLATRPVKQGINRAPSEVLAQRAHMVSAALNKGTLRSNSFGVIDKTRSSSTGSVSSEESTEEAKRKAEEKKLQEKEAKQKMKEEKQKAKKDEEKAQKKDDYKRRSASTSSPSLASILATSGSDPSLPTRPKVIITQGPNADPQIPANFAHFSGPDDASSVSSFQSSSLGSSSPLSAGSLDSRKLPTSKARKPKQYAQDNAENYGQMVGLLMRNSFQLMRALETYIKRSDLDRISKDFIALFSWREVTLDYIKSAIRQDVDHAESEGTLFRTNSLLTAVMSGYCQRVGKQYLQAVLGPSFQWLQESTLQFEIDPNQVDNAELIKQNIFNMNYLANKFFKAVLNSNDMIPFEIREIANTLQTAVLKRFPNSKYSAIGGFFFLRFVCPAVLASELFDMVLTEEQSAAMRRPLVLVAKILQQIANDQKFNEPHMEPLNDLISKWTVKVHQFFDLLVQKDHVALHKERDRVLEQMKDPEELDRLLLERIALGSLISVHKFVAEHVEDLVVKFSDKEKELGYNPAEELAELLVDMGPVPEDRNKARGVSVMTKILGL